MKSVRCSPSNVDIDFATFNDSKDHLVSDGADTAAHLADAEQSEPYLRGIANAPSERFLAVFMLISCGYMLPWTSLGSLITYYKATYSADFYVKLYCAYYLPGLPISLLQYKYDVYLDLKHGSQNTYLLRGMISYIVMMSVLVLLVWMKSRTALIFLFTLLGVCGWLCHGTASMLASMYPPSAIAYLQTGFRCPEIYTLIAVSALHLGKNAAAPDLHIFYVLTSSIISIGAVAWAFVVMHDTSKDFFNIKDNRVYATDLSESIPLLRNEKVSSNGTWQVEQRNTFVGKAPFNSYYEQQEYLIAPRGNQNSDLNRPRSDNYVLHGEELDTTRIHDYSPVAGLMEEENTFSRFSSYASPLTRTRNLLRSVERAAMQLQLRPGDIYSMDDALFRRIFPLCLALFTLMWCSIFQASFFAYVSSSTKGRELEQILYFVRLFADLIGRPLTRLPRPFFLKVFFLVYTVLYFPCARKNSYHYLTPMMRSDASVQCGAT